MQRGTTIRFSTQPDLSNPNSTKEYEGDISGPGNAFTRWSVIGPIENYALTQLPTPFSIFKLTLDTAIQPDQSQWMRWHITKPQIQRDWKALPRQIKDFMLNLRTANYSINGPLNVRELFSHYLKDFVAQPATGNAADTKLMGAAVSLDNKLTELLSNTLVSVQDWRIHVFPNTFFNIENINKIGDVLPFGGLPTVIAVPDKKILQQLVYQWRAGTDHIPLGKQEQKGHFSISFSVRDPNYFIRVLPWIAIGISLVSLMLRAICC